MVSNRKKKRKLEIMEKEVARFRRVAKVIDDYCYKNRSAKECMDRIVDIIYGV